QAIERQPKEFDLWWGRGALYWHLGRWDLADADIAKAYQIKAPSSPGERYSAASAAVRAGCGQGKDDKLDGKERARLRRLALDWLRADLEAYRSLLEKDAKNNGRTVVAGMRQLLADGAFPGVRGPEALAKLPEAEQQAWKKLWSDVADLLNRAQGRPPG